MRKNELEHGLTVDGDTHEIADLLNLGTSQTERAEIPKDKVVISATSLELVAVSNELRSEGPGIGNDLLGVLAERGLSSLEEGGSDTGNGVVVRATLARRKDGLVNALLQILGLIGVLAEEDKTGTRATEGLVSKNPVS